MKTLRETNRQNNVQANIENLEAKFLEAVRRIDDLEFRQRTLVNSRSYNFGKFVLGLVKKPWRIVFFPKLLRDLSRWRAESGDHPKLAPYVELLLSDSPESMLDQLERDNAHLSDLELAGVLRQTTASLSEIGFDQAELQIALRSVQLDPSPANIRAVFLASRKNGDINTACEMVALYSATLGPNPSPGDAKRLRQMRSDPVYQLSVRDYIGAPNMAKRTPIPKRICYVLHNSLPYASGGYATRAHGLARAMSKLGFEVICLTRTGFPVDLEDHDKELPSEDVVDGIRYIRSFQPRRRTLPFVDYVPAASNVLEDLIHELNPEFVIAASNYISALPALAAANRLGIPFFYEVRGFWEVTRASREAGYIQTPGYQVQEEMERFVANLATHTFTLTRAMANELVARGINDEQITLLPNACNPNEFNLSRTNKGAKALLGVPEAVAVIGYVGTFVDYEGLPDLVQACARLRENGLDFRLLLVGSDNTSDNLEGPVSKAIRETAERYNLTDLLLTPGRVPHEQVPDYYAAIDIAVFPRRPWFVCEMVSPMKPLEALAMEKAVVVSSVSALQEMIQDDVTGLVYEKGDNNDLAEKLSLLISNQSLRERLGLEGRKWVLENRTWERVAQDLVSQLTRLHTAT